MNREEALAQAGKGCEEAVHQYVELDLKMKERSLKKPQAPPATSRFKPSDSLLAFLEALWARQYYADMASWNPQQNQAFSGTCPHKFAPV